MDSYAKGEHAQSGGTHDRVPNTRTFSRSHLLNLLAGTHATAKHTSPFSYLLKLMPEPLRSRFGAFLVGT
jgi:hypothetical protein